MKALFFPDKPASLAFHHPWRVSAHDLGGITRATDGAVVVLGTHAYQVSFNAIEGGTKCERESSIYNWANTILSFQNPSSDNPRSIAGI